MNAPNDLGHVHQDLSDRQVTAAASLMRLVAEPLRLRLLLLLAQGESDVTTLSVRAGVPRPAVSQQLARLRAGGLVSVEKSGRRMVYRLRGGHVRSLIKEVLAHADHLVSGYPEHD